MTGGNDEGLKLPPMKDVVVIGGGIVGVCAAVVLARAGRDVVVIERGDIGGATSFGNAGVMADSYVAVANNPDSGINSPQGGECCGGKAAAN